MAPKRKADDNRTGTRQPAAPARTDTTAGDDLAGTSAQTSGPRANAAGDGIAGTSQALGGLTAATTGSAGGSSQFVGVLGPGPRDAWSGQSGRGFAPPHRHPFTQFGGAARGAGGGSGYRGFSQPHGRAPSQGMLQPPLGNPAGGRPPFPYQHHAPTGHGFFPGQNQIVGPLQTGTGQPQMPSQGMLRPPLGNPAGGRPPFTHQYPAPNGHGQLPSQNQIAGPLQTGTGPPRSHSGSGGPSSAISCASASGAPAPVSPLHRACPRCNRSTIVFWGLAPLCVDCYTHLFLSNVLQKHPEIRHLLPSYGGASATQGQGIATGHQRQLEHRLRQQPSSAEPARLAVGPGPWCGVCLAATRRVYGSSPLCELCYNRYFVTGDVPPQHAQAGHVLPSHARAPRGAAAIRPSSGSSSRSAVGSGPICQACGHPLGTGNRACRFCHSNGPPPPGPGLG